MKLYNSVGPNPHVVRMFMAERGLTVPTEEIDLMGGANRQEPYLSVNPAGQMPALVLDDGTLITEVTAICEYLDETQPGDSLIGTTPAERAQTRRWTRWADLNIVEPADQWLPLCRRPAPVQGAHALHPGGGRRPQGHRTGQACLSRCPA